MDEGSDTLAAPKTGEAGRPDPEEDPPLPAPLQKPDPTAKKKKGCRCRCPACPTLSSKVVIDLLMDVPQFYCQTLASRPSLYLVFWMIVVLVVLPLTWRPISVDTDVNAYRRADTVAARNHLVYLDSLNKMRAVRNESALGERTTLKLELLYEAKDGDVFAESVLRDIRAFEQALRSLEGWSKLCNMSEPALQFQCSPGESFGNYVWPKRLDNFLTSDGFFRLSFDGSASERLPLDAVVAYLREGRAHPHELRVFLPMDFTDGGSSRLLRSIFGFTAPSLDDAEFRKNFQEFVEKQLYSAMKEVVLFTRKPVDPTSWDKPPSMQIYFRGDLLDDYEVLQALHGDMLLAIGPLILSLILAWVKFRSAFLALAATTFLCLTVLLAYAILPVEKVSLASFLGVFMIFGLGFTSFFRMHELWRRSRLEAVDLSERLIYLHTAAGREMLPVVCTSLCYFLLLTSNLVPLREFGIFIGTSMLLAVALAVLCFVPVLLLHEVHVRPLLRRRAAKLILVLEPAQLKPDWEMLAPKIMLLLRRPKPLLGGTALVVFICAVAALAVTAQQPYPELPEVFPQEHHREAGRPLLQSFQHVKPAEEAAPYTIRMCEPGRNLSSCALHWCDLHNTATSNLTEWPSTQAASCSCWTPVDMTTMCSNITVSMTISGSRVSELTQDVVMPEVESFMQQQFSDADYLATSSVASRRLQSVVLEDWPTGATHVDPMTQMPDISLGFPTPRLSTRSCHETHYCYCSPKVCLNPTGYQRTSTALSLPALSTTSDSTTATSQTSTEVVVLFGIQTPNEHVNLLAKTINAEFDTSFDPASPWAQRAMLRVCDELAPTLQVLSSRCWILDFRAWLYSRGQKFPVERFLDFHQTLKEFLVSYPSASSSMWFDASDNLTATMFSFQVTPANGATATLAARDLWLNYMAQLNADASSTASNAWATSQAWVDAASLQDALTSAWQAIKVCKFLVDEDGIINTKQLFEWLYDGMVSGVDYEEGLRLHYEVPASRWCITRDDFAQFLEEVLAKHHAGRIHNRPRPQTEELNPFHDDMEIGPNMHCVNLDVIRPRTAMAGGMSWALMLNPNGLESDFFFVTHSWQEGVYEFCRKVLNHWQNEALSMWCCFLANPQTWHRQDLNQLLGNRFDLTDSPFMQALADERLHSFVVVPNVTESLYCRLWCVAELWKAMEVQKLRGQSMIHVAKDAVKPAHKARPVETISAMIHGASCSDENDEQRIRAYIAGNELHIEDMIKDLATTSKTSKTSKMEKKMAGKCKKASNKVKRGASLKDRFGAARSQVPVQGGGAAPGAPIEPIQQQGIEQQGFVLLEPTVAIFSSYIYEEVDERESIDQDVARVYDVAREREEVRRLDCHSEGRRAEELRHIALEERIKEIREKVERQRQQESEVEKLLMMKVENLEEALEIRRRSIMERTSRERDREEALSRYLRLLEEADITDLKQEIRTRRHSAMLKEEKLQQQLAGLAAEPLNEAVELEAERDQIEERLQKQITLRRQLESLDKSEGTSSVRRHLVALKQAEMAELKKEVERHRLEDEAKEEPMRHELQELHADWQRFRAESESRRHAFEEHEEQILSEIAMLRAQEASAGKEEEEPEELTPLTPLTPVSPTIGVSAERKSSHEEAAECDRWSPAARLRSEDRSSSSRGTSSSRSQEIERPGFVGHEDSDEDEADDLLFI